MNTLEQIKAALAELGRAQPVNQGWVVGEYERHLRRAVEQIRDAVQNAKPTVIGTEARDLVLYDGRATEMATLADRRELTDSENAILDRIDNEITRTRAAVRAQIFETFGVTYEELERIL